MRKSVQHIEFRYESHIEHGIKLLWQVDDAGELFKEICSLINQLETKFQDLEEEKHRSEAQCCKAMKDMV